MFHQAGQHASLAGVAAENIGKAGGKYRLEAVVAQCPYCVLTGRTRAEVRASEQHRAILVRLLVQYKVLVFTPVGKQAILKARALDRLEVDRRDNLVGIHIGITQRNANAGVRGELFHNLLLLIRLRSLIRGLIRSRVS